MFSILSLFTRSPSVPTLPVSSVDATLVSSSSRSSVRERVRAAWQSLVVVIVSIFAGGMAPASDIQEAVPSVADTRVCVPEACTPPIPVLAEIPVCPPLSPTFQPQGRMVVNKDSGVSVLDADLPPPLPRIQGLACEELAIPAPALRVFDNIPVTPELGLAITVPDLVLSPAPSETSVTPIPLNWDLLVPVHPGRRTSGPVPRDAKDPTVVPSGETSTSSSATGLQRMSKSQQSRPSRVDPEVGPASRVLSTDSAPIVDTDIYELILSCYQDDAISHEHTLSKSGDSVSDVSSIRSTSPSDVEGSLFDRSMNSSITTVDTEAPSAADSSSESMLSVPICLQDKLVPEAKGEVTIEQGTKSPSEPSVQPKHESEVDSCYAWALSLYFDEVNPEFNAAQETKTTSEVQVDCASAPPASGVICNAEASDKLRVESADQVKQDVDTDCCSTWSLVSHYLAEVEDGVEQRDATKPGLPTENTSSTLSDIAEPFRYDTNRDWLWRDEATGSKQTPNEEQAPVVKSADPESKSGLSTDNSSSTIADIADPFRYDTDRNETSCEEDILAFLAEYDHLGDAIAVASNNDENEEAVGPKDLPSGSCTSTVSVSAGPLSFEIRNHSINVEEKPVQNQGVVGRRAKFGDVGPEQGFERGIPTENTSSTIADLADPFRYDTNRNSTSYEEEIVALLTGYGHREDAIVVAPNDNQDVGSRGRSSDDLIPVAAMPVDSLPRDENDNSLEFKEVLVQKRVIDGDHSTAVSSSSVAPDHGSERSILTKNTSSTIADLTDPLRHNTSRGWMSCEDEILNLLAEYEYQDCGTATATACDENIIIQKDRVPGLLLSDGPALAASVPVDPLPNEIGKNSMNAEEKTAQKQVADGCHVEPSSVGVERDLELGRSLPTENTSSTIADLADPFRYDTNRDWMDCEEILDILADYEHRDNDVAVSDNSEIGQGARLREPPSDGTTGKSTLPVLDGPSHSNANNGWTEVEEKVPDKQAVDTDHSGAHLVAVSGITKVKQDPEHELPTESTSSTLADILDPFRYDTGYGQLGLSDTSVDNQSSDTSQDPSVSSGPSPSDVAEDQSSSNPFPSSSFESTILPVENDIQPNPIVSDLPAIHPSVSLSTEPRPDRAKDTNSGLQGSKFHPKCFLPRLRIQVPSELLPLKPNIRSTSQGQGASESELDAARKSLLSPPLTPAKSNPLRGILKKDNKQKSSNSASAVPNPRHHSVSGIPTRSTPSPILPSKEDRRSASSTASSRLKKREAATYFVFRSEPPPMPALPFPLPPKSPATVYRSTTPLTPVSPVGSRLKLRTPPESPKLDSSPPPVPYSPYNNDAERNPEPSSTQASSHHNRLAPAGLSTFMKRSPLGDDWSSKTINDKENQTTCSAPQLASGPPARDRTRRRSRIPGLASSRSPIGRRSSSPLGSIPEFTHKEPAPKPTQTPVAAIQPTKNTSRSRRMGMTFGHCPIAERLDELPQHHEPSKLKVPASHERLNSTDGYTRSNPAPHDRSTSASPATITTPLSGGPAAAHLPVKSGKSVHSPAVANSNTSRMAASDSRLTPSPERRPEVRPQEAAAYLASARAALQASIQSERTTPPHKSNRTKSKRGASLLSRGRQHSRLNT